MTRLPMATTAARAASTRSPLANCAYRPYATAPPPPGPRPRPSADDDQQPTIHLAAPDPSSSSPPGWNPSGDADTPATLSAPAPTPAPTPSLPPPPTPFPSNTLGRTLAPPKRLDPSTPIPPPPHPPSTSTPYAWRQLGSLGALAAPPEISDLSKRARQAITRAIADAAKHLTLVGLKLNEVTGYHTVERLKASVAAQEAALSAARDAAQAAKQKYDEAVASRSTAQQDVNALLERKHSWTDADVLAFTTLVRQDHASTLAVTTTSAQLKDAEAQVDKAFSQLTNAILQRYHEEQVWSDKIRSVSTWANVGGLIFNFVIFIGAIAIVEPWKRKRLVERMEERMNGLIARVESQIEGVGHRLDAVAAQGATGAEAIAPDAVPAALVEPLQDQKQETPKTTAFPQTYLSTEYINYAWSRTTNALTSYKWLGDDNQVITSLLGAVGGAVVCAAAVSIASSR